MTPEQRAETLMEILGLAREDDDARKAIAAAIEEAVAAELAALRAERDGLREVVKVALDPGVFGPWGSVEDPRLVNTNLLQLCKDNGFGAVMHYVEYLWSKHGSIPGSEHTCAACASVRREWIEAARAALAKGGA